MGCSWAADGTGYGWLAEEDTKQGKKRREREEEKMGHLQGGFLEAEGVRVGDIQTRGRKVTRWDIQVRSFINL